MRIATSQIYNNLLTGVRNQLNLQNTGNAQISSGTRFQTPAQAGMDYKISLNIRQAQTDVNGSIAAAKTAEARLNVSQTVMTDINNLLTRAKTIAIQHGTAGINAAERQVAGNKVGRLISQFLNDANTQWQGQSLFSGTAVDKAAFVQDPVSGAITYNGSAQDRIMSLSANQQITSNIRGDDPAFLNSIQALQNLQTSLQNNDVAGVQNAIGTVSTALDGMVSATTDVGGRLGNVRNYLVTYQDMKTQLDVRLSNHESVDVASVMTQLQQSNIALQAAYSQISKMGSLSLTKYI